MRGRIRVAVSRSSSVKWTWHMDSVFEANEVRQAIEVSTDSGEEWRTVFDARYVRHH